mmetsp:Transcript_6302/g.23244  ORF Transcript_6302/g.23244 Transcript_6302/m.23244 type:complete len:421 (+) Transcript_6302:119-1381(+)
MAQESQVATTSLARLLADQSYDIEFNAFLTNHVKHALIALAKLARDEDNPQIAEYWRRYTLLTLYGLKLEPAEPVAGQVDSDNWTDFLGKKRNFEGLCEFFDREITRLGEEVTVQQYAPKLLPGCAGALTHGIIHLGWAIDAGIHHRRMLVEGLAYMVFSYLEVFPERCRASSATTGGDRNAFSSMRRLLAEAEQKDLVGWMTEVRDAPEYGRDSGFHPELLVAGFQRELAKVLHKGLDSMYDIPPWLTSDEPASAILQLHKALSLLYLATAIENENSLVPSGSGDFFILHLITSLWGVEQVGMLLPIEQQREAVRCYWVLMVALVVARCGLLERFPSVSLFDKLVARYEDSFDGTTEAATPEESWPSIVSRAMLEDEEHNIKLAYVERELWHRADGWTAFRDTGACFTATPTISPVERR